MIRIFEHMIMKGMRDHKGQWWKVTQGCARCGACCRDMDFNWHFADGKGGCTYLKLEDDEKTYRCDLKGYRPFGCCGNNPEYPLEGCSVVLERIDDPTTLLQL